MRHRLDAARARSDTREWVVKRRERTRHLIELGGLVTKAELVELTGDDRTAIYGALLSAADRLGGEERAQTLVLWRPRGHRAFVAEMAEKARSLGRKLIGAIIVAGALAGCSISDCAFYGETDTSVRCVVRGPSPVGGGQ